MIVHRHTVAAPLEIEGVGLHSAHPVRLVIHPGEDGIAFRQGPNRWAATPENVTDTRRCTKLGEISTIEHLMSAFAGLEITDAEVEVFGPEMPGLDGSAKVFMEALVVNGFLPLDDKEVAQPFARIFHKEEHLSVSIAKGQGHWRYDYILDGRWPGTQTYETGDVIEAYAQEIAPARTFCLAEEVPFLIEHGLGKGLDENSALIVGIEGYKNDARFEDEPARHKLLDLIGDLYLAGIPIRQLNAVGDRSGHRSHVAAAKSLRDALRAT